MSFTFLLVLLVFILVKQSTPLRNASRRFWASLYNGTLLHSTSSTDQGLLSLNKNKGVNTEERLNPSESNVTSSSRSLRSRRGERICRIETIEKRWVLDVNVTFHHDGNGSNWYTHVTWAPPASDTPPWIEFYVMYTVEGDENVQCDFLPKNQTSVNITADGWDYTKYIYIAVVAIPKFPSNATDRIHMPPYRPYTSEGTTFLPEDITGNTNDKHKMEITAIAIGVGILIGLCLVGLWLVYHRPSKTARAPPEGFKYHAFICYSSHDSGWVQDVLLPFLEEENNLCCCIHYRDFEPGIPFVINMADRIYESCKTIAVFSKNFCESSYCMYELNVACHRDVEDGDHRVVVVRIDNTSSSELPRDLQKKTFIDYYSRLERRSWKARLLKFLTFKEQDFRTRVSRSYVDSSSEELNNNFNNRDSGSSSSSSSSCTSNSLLFEELSFERLV